MGGDGASSGWRIPCCSSVPQPFWRRGSGRPDPRLVLLLVLEFVLIVLLLILVGSVVIPWAAPHL